MSGLVSAQTYVRIKWRNVGITSQIFKQRELVPIGCIVVVSLAIGACSLLPSRAPMEPWVASASVIDGGTNLSAKPDPASEALANLKAGSVVHVIAVPRSGVRWAKVQPVESGKPGKAGFVVLAQLTSFDAPLATDALALARALIHGEQDTSLEIAAQIRELERVAAKYPAEQPGVEAQLDIARLELVLARRSKVAGEPLERWMPRVERAESAARIGARDSNLKRRADALLAMANGIRPTAAEPAAEEVKPVERPVDNTPSVDKIIAWVEQLVSQKRYNEAESAIGVALRREPSNAKAKSLRDRIQKHREVERLLGN